MTEQPLPLCMALLREELVRAAARRHARSRPVLVALVAVAAMVTTLLVTRPVPALADVRVEVAHGQLSVTLVDLEHRPRQIEAVLRGVGLRASVTAAPVGPSEVGRFVGTTDELGLAPQLTRIDAGPASFAGFSVPVGWDGPLELHVGRPAQRGERYAVFSDALAPGEPLACRSLLGRAAGEVASTVIGVGLEAVFHPQDHPGGGGLRTAAEVQDGPLRHWTVSAVEATDASRVLVRLVAPGAAPPIHTTSPRCPA